MTKLFAVMVVAGEIDSVRVARGELRRQDLQRREAGRSTDRTADKI
jgi:hypothetical protein